MILSIIRKKIIQKFWSIRCYNKSADYLHRIPIDITSPKKQDDDKPCRDDCCHLCTFFLCQGLTHPLGEVLALSHKHKGGYV